MKILLGSDNKKGHLHCSPLKSFLQKGKAKLSAEDKLLADYVFKNYGIYVEFPDVHANLQPSVYLYVDFSKSSDAVSEKFKEDIQRSPGLPSINTEGCYGEELYNIAKDIGEQFLKIYDLNPSPVGDAVCVYMLDIEQQALISTYNYIAVNLINDPRWNKLYYKILIDTSPKIILLLEDEAALNLALEADGRLRLFCKKRFEKYNRYSAVSDIEISYIVKTQVSREIWVDYLMR